MCLRKCKPIHLSHKHPTKAFEICIYDWGLLNHLPPQTAVFKPSRSSRCRNGSYRSSFLSPHFSNNSTVNESERYFFSFPKQPTSTLYIFPAPSSRS
ncbi:hypothetical protein L2E82_10619 [Cichorium intybus]|uniref:Uncharacterized protein n=1 Tax=Cichorium intybus TaxID=13427 RepID=A0ACB9GB27_CICIN|nr:hypothetical protein L2E82_10619 [Cichorium intybus]